MRYGARKISPPRTGEQHHFSSNLVRNGYWADEHLSIMAYAPKDRQVFLDFLNAIRVEPKTK